MGWLLLQLLNHAYLSTLPIKFFRIDNNDYFVRFSFNWLVSLLIIFPGYTTLIILIPIFNLVEIIIISIKVSSPEFLWLSWESILEAEVDISHLNA